MDNNGIFINFSDMNFEELKELKIKTIKQYQLKLNDNINIAEDQKDFLFWICNLVLNNLIMIIDKLLFKFENQLTLKEKNVLLKQINIINDNKNKLNLTKINDILILLLKEEDIEYKQSRLKNGFFSRNKKLKNQFEVETNNLYEDIDNTIPPQTEENIVIESDVEEDSAISSQEALEIRKVINSEPQPIEEINSIFNWEEKLEKNEMNPDLEINIESNLIDKEQDLKYEIKEEIKKPMFKEEASLLVEIARIISKDTDVVNEITKAINDYDLYFKENIDYYKNIYFDFDENIIRSENEILTTALIDELTKKQYSFYMGLKYEPKEFINEIMPLLNKFDINSFDIEWNDNTNSREFYQKTIDFLGKHNLMLGSISTGNNDFNFFIINKVYKEEIKDLAKTVGIDIILDLNEELEM